ncbi:hypothetical protein [Niabella ginsenosidivorans]|nr:hypothetical protein [Niabella ginsenosidivorans]
MAGLRIARWIGHYRQQGDRWWMDLLLLFMIGVPVLIARLMFLH